jgi:thymidylate kinase
LVFVLDASEEERAKRKAKRNNTDRFESAPEDYLNRVKQGFEWLKGLEKKSNKIITIDTSGTIEMTHTEIYRCAAFRIGKLKDGQLEIDKAKQIITI